MENKDFYFVGKGPLSKSLLNRALIVKSLFPDFLIRGGSDCQDIQIMTEAVKSFPQSFTYHCGLSGSALRFLALRFSRERGKFLLTGKSALLDRPFYELPILLNQLSVDVKELKGQGWLIDSKGWIPQGDSVHVPCGISSQYASALLLSGWDLDRDLYFSLSRNPVSFSYFKMTLDFVRYLGMKVEGEEMEYRIPAKQRLKIFSYTPEQDKSSLFALAAFAAIKGKCLFKPWEADSLQPDNIFPDVLNALGVEVKEEGNLLKIQGGVPLKSIDFDLRNCPDLFPVLSVLCARAKGTSCLSNVRNQAFKESHRLNKVCELLDLSGIETKKRGDDFLIFGKGESFSRNIFQFDCSKDHRMAMAAALMKEYGQNIRLIGKEAVNKSFPDFFQFIFR